MSKLAIIFLLMALVLTPVMPLAASPIRESATETPTPIVPTATLTPIIVRPLDSSGRYDPEEMEEFRRALLDMTDVLDELYPFAETYVQVSGVESPPRVDRQLIQGLTHEELYMAREAFGEEFKLFKDDVKALRSLVLNPEKRLIEGEESLGPSPDSSTTLSSPAPLTSMGIIPAPIPVTTPPPGIWHDADHIEQVNETLEDFAPPDYYSLCPQTRFDPRIVLTEIILVDIERLAAFMADIISCNATLLVVCVPFGGGTNVPGCIAAAVIKGIGLVAEAVLEGINLCIWAVDRAELKTAHENTEYIHAELAMHDENLTTRFNWTDNDLFHFRNLNLRSRIEANLASPEDDPISLFTLPSAICVTTDLEVFNQNDPGEQFSSERIAGCGLLEVVSDTVRSAIDMNQNAGQDVNNAEAEFAAAVEHYNNSKWKLAYARFRKAYREAVRP
ncbi:MAG: hypothetical protein ACE5JQ_14315 [Candidatus Methylomirabilales bacterium]